MQYLFNKTYLMLDNMFEQATPNVLISPVVDITPTDAFNAALIEIDMGEVLLSAPSFEQAVEAAGSEQQLFDLIANHDETQRLYIYASPEAYLTIMIKWYKALLVNLNADTAYTLFMLILYRMRYTFGYNYAPRKLLTPEAASQYWFLASYLPAKADFEELWNNTVPFDMSTKGRDYFVQRCGVEYQLATYFTNPLWEHKHVLETKLVGFVKSMTINMFEDMIDTTVMRALRLPGFDIHTQTIEDWIVTNPQFSYLIDTKLNSDNLEYVYNTYGTNIRELFAQSIELAGFDPDFNTIDNVMMVGQEITIDRVIDVELTACPYSILIATSKRAQSVDTYVLNRLYEERRKGNNAFAQKLAL